MKTIQKINPITINKKSLRNLNGELKNIVLNLQAENKNIIRLCFTGDLDGLVAIEDITINTNELSRALENLRNF